MRVYELAKELGKTSKDLIVSIRDMSIDVKNNFSNLDQETVDKVKASYTTINAKQQDSDIKPNFQKDLSSNAKTQKKTEKESVSAQKDLSSNNAKTQKKTEKESVSAQKDLSSNAKTQKKTEKKSVSAQKDLSSNAKTQKKTDKDPIREIFIKFPITVKKLASKLEIKNNELVQKLMKKKIFATINQEISEDLVEDLLMEYHCILVREKKGKTHPSLKYSDANNLFDDLDHDSTNVMTRAPIVTVMGHVDHGKTSLLSALHKKAFTDGEAGGITQHIGAYQLNADAYSITFIDTPGHEMFSSMRSRGAQITDIVVLVIAADEGVKPQTVEAINHAKSANVSILVALNKCDKPDVDPDKVRNELAKYDLIPEEWGGETIFVEVSAKTMKGLDLLLEMLMLQAELLELKANPSGPAKGVVIESHSTKGQGAIVSVIITSGTLSIGDILLSENTFGKVKALINDQGKSVLSANVSMPVQIVGFDLLPQPGVRFTVLANEKELRFYQQKFLKGSKNKNRLVVPRKIASLEDLYSQILKKKIKDINLLIKSDSLGSLEALKESLLKLNNKKVTLKIIHSGVGLVNESDIDLAQSTSACILSFHLKPHAKIQKLAEKAGVQIKYYNIIYEVIDEIYSVMEGSLEKKEVEQVIGKVEVRALFKSSKLGSILGCFVLTGKITNRSFVRVFRKDKKIASDTIHSLRREKDEVKDIKAGYECGILLKKFQDIEVGDILEVYFIEKQKQFLND